MSKSQVRPNYALFVLIASCALFWFGVGKLFGLW